MKATMELARAAKYYMIMEETIFGEGNYLEAHKVFVEKLEEYEKAEGLTEAEAQENVMEAVQIIKDNKENRK